VTQKWPKNFWKDRWQPPSRPTSNAVSSVDSVDTRPIGGMNNYNSVYLMLKRTHVP